MLHYIYKTEKYSIRPIRPEEFVLLEDFLYEAIFVPEGAEPPPKAIVQRDELQLYVKNFGESPHDYCFVAEEAGNIIGAVWCRIMDDYGHVDDDTPSLAMSLCKEYRGRGIGTALLRHMLTFLKASGYKKLSLSVQKDNFAAGMYLKNGFKTAIEKAEEYIMLCDLTK